MGRSSSEKESTKPLIITAAFAGQLKVLKKLVKEHDDGSGIEKIRDSFGRNALHGAAAGQGSSDEKLSVVKYLVEQLKFNVNEQDANGDTPLHISTLEEDYDTPSYLLDHGANPNITSNMGFTPLHCAAKRGRTNLLRLLISKGAKVNAQMVDSYVGTPLQAAAVHGQFDAVEFLLQNHANPNLACDNSQPPLMSAIFAKCRLSARSLIEWGADPNVISRGMTPLIIASAEGQTDIIKCLLLAGADPNVSDFHDVAPIEIAAKIGNHADVRALFASTKPIPGISDWSVRGIIEHVRSAEAKKAAQLKNEKMFVESKEKGAKAVKKGDYLDAIFWYTEAIGLKPTDAALLSNRSLCWSRMKEGERALEDAMACIELKGDWPKAHYRTGVAYGLLRDYERAEKEFKIALDLDPENKELQDAYREAVLDVHAVEMYKKKQGLPSKFDVDPPEEEYAEYISSLL